MKTAAFVLLATFVTLGLLTFLYVEHVNQNVSLKLKDSELKALRESNAEITRNYELRGDSILIALATIRNLHAETEKAKLETKAYRKKFESVKFVRYESDSARNGALKRLYKSYQP